MSGKANYLTSNYSKKQLSTSYDYKLVQRIFSLGKIAPKVAILDLACGTGSFKSVFKKMNIDYYGVDIDNEDVISNIIRCDIANTQLPYANDFLMLYSSKWVLNI